MFDVPTSVPVKPAAFEESATEQLLEAVFSREVDDAKAALAAGADPNHANEVCSFPWLLFSCIGWWLMRWRWAVRPRYTVRHVAAWHGCEHWTCRTCRSAAQGWSITVDM